MDRHFFLFTVHHVESYFPNQGIKPILPALQGGVLTTRLLGKSRGWILLGKMLA